MDSSQSVDSGRPKLTETEKEQLFQENIQQIDLMYVAAGRMVKGLLMELERNNRNTYIRLRDAVPNGNEVFYDFVQGDRSLIRRIARALGFKTVTDSKLEVPRRDQIEYSYHIDSSLDKLSKAAPTDVQEIAASQIALLNVYHDLVLTQARRSFFWGLIAASVGLIFFIAAVTLVLLNQFQSVAVISLISGALVQVISGINFYLYGKTSSQLADFQIRLDMTQRFLLANSICERLEGDYKQQARSELIKAIASSGAVTGLQLTEKTQKP